MREREHTRRENNPPWTTYAPDISPRDAKSSLGSPQWLTPQYQEPTGKRTGGRGTEPMVPLSPCELWVTCSSRWVHQDQVKGSS